MDLDDNRFDDGLNDLGTEQICSQNRYFQILNPSPRLVSRQNGPEA